MARITKQAALDAGNVLDKAADLITDIAKQANIPPEVAKKFALQCDLLSDHVAKQAGIDIAKMAAERKQALTGDDIHDEGAHGEDPEVIGEEKSGPQEGDSDESYMSGEFTQQENRELREKQEGGELGMDKTSPEPQAPRPGIQASLDAGKKLAALYTNFAEAATKCASSEHEAVQQLGEKLASTGNGILQFQARLMEGKESFERIASLEGATSHLLPHLAGEVSPKAAAKLARMSDIISGIANPA